MEEVVRELPAEYLGLEAQVKPTEMSRSEHSGPVGPANRDVHVTKEPTYERHI